MNLQVKIRDMLEKDGFKNIDINEHYIQFDIPSMTRRVELTGNDFKDLTFSINFDILLPKILEIKLDYSNDLANIMDKNPNASIAEACRRLKWQYLASHNIMNNLELDCEIELIHSCAMHSVKHIVIENQVFEGNINVLLDIFKQKSSDFLANTHIYNYIKN